MGTRHPTQVRDGETASMTETENEKQDELVCSQRPSTAKRKTKQLSKHGERAQDQTVERQSLQCTSKEGERTIYMWRGYMP